MKTVIIRESKEGTALIIDGVDFGGVYEFTIKKERARPITISLTAPVLKECQIGPLSAE